MEETKIKKRRGRLAGYVPSPVPAGKDVTDRKDIDDSESIRDKVAAGDPTDEDLAWIKQKTYDMKRELFLRRKATRLSRVSAREKAFWERQKKESHQNETTDNTGNI